MFKLLFIIALIINIKFKQFAKLCDPMINFFVNKIIIIMIGITKVSQFIINPSLTQI